MQNTNVPNGWSIQKLGDIFKLSAGGDVDKSLFSERQDADHLYPIFANALTNQGLYGYSSDYRVEEESITITGRGDIGKVFYREGKYTPIVRLIVGIPKKDISAKYMSYACSCIHFFNETTGVPQLTVPQVSWYKIAVPPIEEQKKIAEILGTWDRAIEELTGLIAEKKELKRGLMQRLLTGTKRLPGFTKPWRKVKLGEVADLYQPVTISAQELSETGFPVYGANGLIGYYEKYNHDTWQIMITCRGSTCGTVNRTYGKSWITGNAMVVNCDNHNVCKLFLYYNLLNRKFNSVISGSGQPQIVRGPLLKYPLCLPADLAEQKAIADVLSKADAEIDLLNQQLDVLREQKRGLMQKLLTGEIRVKMDTETC